MLKEPPRPAPPAGAPGRTINAPIPAQAELGLARIVLLQGNVERARAQLEKLTEEWPKFGAAFRLLGGAYATLNRAADAQRAIRAADRLPAYDPYVDPM